ncbi:E3 ubiquitin protein ligase SINAT2 [Tanacetum coccineum]
MKFKGLPASGKMYSTAMGDKFVIRLMLIFWEMIAFIRFMGEDIEAKEFRYSLEMGVDRRELKWQGVPKSI